MVQHNIVYEYSREELEKLYKKSYQILSADINTNRFEKLGTIEKAVDVITIYEDHQCKTEDSRYRFTEDAIDAHFLEVQRRHERMKSKHKYTGPKKKRREMPW